jgi:siderophore synthetase component
MTIPSLIYADRYRNEGTRTYSQHADYTEAQDKYRPDSRHSQFELAVFEVPRDQMQIYTANPSIALAEKYLAADQILFCIHPQIYEEKSDDKYVRHTLSIGTPCNGIVVVPSSSSRTLYVQDDKHPHAVKVHFPFRISRYGRKMRDEVIAQAINISAEIENGIDGFDDRFAFLREVIGVAHRNLHPGSARGDNWGYLVRDMQPFPQTDDERQLVPGFALYGQDFFNPSKTLLLFKLIENKDPQEYVLENIMLPIVRHWVACFRCFGFMLEPHGQNVLLEVDKRKVIKRIVHRDLSLGIDMRRRRDMHLPNDHLNNYNRMESAAFHSITYDMFMGSHFFDRIVAACQEKYPDLDGEDFHKPCRDEFARIFPEHAKYLPKTIWYFSEERDQFGKPLYQNTRSPPIWRP